MSDPAVFLARAVQGDLPALLAIERVSSPRPWQEPHFLAELEHGSPLVLRAAVGLVAFCAFRQVVDELHVRNLAVAPDWRRRGLGRRLLELTLARSRRLGARRALLEVRIGNGPARALYEAVGFEQAALRPGGYTDAPEAELLLTQAL